MLPDLARSPDLGRPDLARSGKFFFFFEKKNFPRRPRSGQIWPDLAKSGRSGTSGKIFFSRYPNDITKYRLKYRSIYVARVCKLRSRTHKVYQTINQSDKTLHHRKIVGTAALSSYLLRRQAKQRWAQKKQCKTLGINMRTNSQQHRLPK